MRLEEAKRDHYRKRAKEEGYRSRAAYKLSQINDKYHIIRVGYRVVDVGCAPGGWLEVAAELVGPRGLVVGVDLVPVRQVGKNVKILHDDVTSQGFLERLKESLGKGKADCIIADLSPKLSGIWDMDHFRQVELCQIVIDLYPETLAPEGSVVLKAFQGDELTSLIKRLKFSFGRVEISKPDASRKESSEVYLVGLEFTGQVRPSENEAPREEHQSESPSDSIESGWQTDRLT